MPAPQRFETAGQPAATLLQADFSLAATDLASGFFAVGLGG